jgi:nucleoside-diphosphate-sugar epimerase
VYILIFPAYGTLNWSHLDTIIAGTVYYMPQKNKSKVFITGASGFVGANLVRFLLKKNYSVHIIHRTTTLPWRLKEIKDQLMIHRADITDYRSLKIAISEAQPDYIIHLAAYGAYHYQTELEKIISVNVLGLQNLLKASEQIPYKCFINTGSSSEYGIKNKPMKETDFCDPVSFYAATKLAATNIGKVYAKQNNKPIVTFRLFSVYGPYEEPGRLIPTIMKALLKKEVINLSSGTQRRDFISVEDVCRAYETALHLKSNISGEIFNIGTGSEYSNDEIVHRLFTVTKDTTRIKKGTYTKRSWDTTHWQADISYSTKRLRWRPRLTIDKGLQNSYSWFANNSHYYK